MIVFGAPQDLAKCDIVEFECFAPPDTTGFGHDWPATVWDQLNRAFNNWSADAKPSEIRGETTYLSYSRGGRRVCRRIIHFIPPEGQKRQEFVSGLPSSGGGHPDLPTAEPAPVAGSMSPAAGVTKQTAKG